MVKSTHSSFLSYAPSSFLGRAPKGCQIYGWGALECLLNPLFLVGNWLKNIAAFHLRCISPCLEDVLKIQKRFRWFQGFDWEGLDQRKLTPPIVPKVSSCLVELTLSPGSAALTKKQHHFWVTILKETEACFLTSVVKFNQLTLAVTFNCKVLLADKP